MSSSQNQPLLSRPGLLVSHANAQFADSVCRYFQRRGWNTHRAASGPDVRLMARELAPAVIVLGTELAGESGWLTCHKLVHDHPGQKVILVSERWSPDNRQFAAFVGAAAFVHEEAAVVALARELEESTPLSAVS